MPFFSKELPKITLGLLSKAAKNRSQCGSLVCAPLVVGSSTRLASLLSASCGLRNFRGWATIFVPVAGRRIQIDGGTASCRR
eukprot:4366486-Amphidinium_carterae.1